MMLNIIKNILKQIQSDKRGNMLLLVMVFGSISFTVIVAGISGFALIENKAAIRKFNSEMAFQIADAGVNYYKWHLAHDKTDYYDSTTTPGPYVHEYKDKNGNVVGHFSLQISPPANGNTIIVMTSTGWIDAQPETKRSIKVRLGFPSLTDFAFLTNSDAWIDTFESTHGKFHSNGGIRFDGTGDAPITSARSNYICKTYHGCDDETQNGIWGVGRPKSYWTFPVPAEDFNVITADLAQIQTAAQEDGIDLSSSGAYGWRLQFLASGQINISKVATINCYNAKDINSSTCRSRCIDAKTFDTPDVYAMPANGRIFVDDNVWVDGVVKGRLVVGTSVGKSIMINGNLTYAAKDGSNVLGLIAEQNILIPTNAPSTLEIDAALLAQNGAAKVYNYAACTNNPNPFHLKNSITTYGSIISNNVWTWTWTNNGSVVSGYRNTNATYDANLTYGPPPNFPVGSEYNIISWEEVR